jgi:hypothetical protein
MRRCVGCGAVFSAVRKWQRFDKPACRARAHREAEEARKEENAGLAAEVKRLRAAPAVIPALVVPNPPPVVKPRRLCSVHAEEGLRPGMTGCITCENLNRRADE